MKTAPLLATILLAGSLPAYARAQSPDCSDVKKRTSVFFANGMFTSPKLAKASLAALRALVESALQTAVGADGVVTFDLAYNQSEPALEQLIEVYSQKAGDDYAAFWRMVSGSELLPGWLKEAIGDATEASMAVQSGAQKNDQDLTQHLARYREALESHAKVIVVSHSQGNFYANDAYAALEAEKAEYGAATGVVGVASPASTVAGAGADGPYVTFKEDWVINAVRFLYPNTLPANATTGTTAVDTLSHGFQSAYLAVPEARATIMRNILDVESRLVPKPKPDPGKDPSCFPPVNDITDPAECANALVGSCVDKFFGTCFDPAGTCSMSPSGASGSTNVIPLDSPTWANGARVDMVADITNPTAPIVNLTVVSSKGSVCATGVSRYLGTECTAQAIYEASGKSLSICAHDDGTALVTCPDGTVISLPTESCIFARQGAGICQ